MFLSMTRNLIGSFDEIRIMTCLCSDTQFKMLSSGYWSNHLWESKLPLQAFQSTFVKDSAASSLCSSEDCEKTDAVKIGQTKQ